MSASDDKKTAPQGGAQTAPKGGAQTAPKGGAQTAPKGGAQTAPPDDKKTAPQGGAQVGPQGDAKTAPGGGSLTAATRQERAFGDTIAGPPPEEVRLALQRGRAEATRPGQRADTAIAPGPRSAPTARGGDATADIARKPDEPTDIARDRFRKTEPGTRPGGHGDADRESLRARIEAAIADSDEEEEQGPQIRKDPLIGTTVANRFVIQSKIGAGGMGAVYKAAQLGMDRSVAIKVLLAEYAKNPMLIKRFHMEALAVSKLEHPNTIRIFDFGQTEQGVLFIAMEFLSGRALEHELRAHGALPVRRALHIMAQVCRSLAEAHEKGIVHRDLKPDNIFLSLVGGDSDYVKVLDFGVAKLAAQENKQGTLTKAGMVFGTPKYMSPEQSRSDLTDARSDIYALGVILYEMLAGKPPFDAENPLSILIQHVQEPVKPFAVVRPDILIPPPVERIVDRCLRKHAGDRYQTAEELAEALSNAAKALDKNFDKVITRDEAEQLGLELHRDEAFTAPAQGRFGLPGQEDETEPMSPEEARALVQRLNRRKRRRQAAVAAAAAAVLAVVAGLVTYFNLPAAPPGFQRVFSQPALALAALPTVDADTVDLTLASTPDGATVYAQGEPIGRAPLAITRLRQEGREVYTFKLDGYEPLDIPVGYDANGEYTATLVKFKPQIVERVITKTVTKEVPVEVERSTRGGHTKPKDGESSGPVTFTGGKVGDLKKLR